MKKNRKLQEFSDRPVEESQALPSGSFTPAPTQGSAQRSSQEAAQKPSQGSEQDPAQGFAQEPQQEAAQVPSQEHEPSTEPVTGRSRRKLVGAHPSSPVPLRGIAVLGRVTPQDQFSELKPSAIMPAQDQIPDFDRISYKKWDTTQLRAKIRRYYGDLRRAKTAAEAQVPLKKINAIWGDFKDCYTLAKLRRVEYGNKRSFYEEEYQRALQAWPLMEKTVFRISGEVLDRSWLSELTGLQGKLILLRINAHYTLSQLGNQDLRAQEKALSKNLGEQLKDFPKSLATGKNLRQPDILMDDLFRTRHELAPRLGFESYREYAWICQEYFDYDRAQLTELRDGIKRYLLPIHLYLEKELESRLPEPDSVETLNNSRRREGQNLAERFSGVRDYYEKVMAEDDWELRHIDEYIPEEETHRSLVQYPSSPLFLVRKNPEEFFSLISTIVDQSLPRPNRGFLRQLGQKGYLRLDFRKSPAKLEADSLKSSPCPVMSGTYFPNSHFVADFLHVCGALYADLLGKQMHPEMGMGAALAQESLNFIGCGMEMMCLPYMSSLFGDESASYARQRISQSLISLLKACLVDEFEESIFTQDALSMSDRNELWDHLRGTYGLTLYTETKFWADPFCVENLLEHPFASLIRALPLYESLTLWDLSRQKKKQARSNYETFCGLGASDTFLEQLKQAGLPDPFSADTLKRLAYQLASFMETTA